MWISVLELKWSRNWTQIIFLLLISSLLLTSAFLMVYLSSPVHSSKLLNSAKLEDQRSLFICRSSVLWGVHSRHDPWGLIVPEHWRQSLEHWCLSLLSFVQAPGLGLRECYKIHLSHKSYFNAKFTKYKLIKKIHDEQYIKILKKDRSYIPSIIRHSPCGKYSLSSNTAFFPAF